MGDLSSCLRRQARVNTKVILLFLLTLFIQSFSQAETIVYVDVDGTLFETRSAYNGTFSTSIILYRIDKTNPIQKTPTGPKMVTVTMQDMKKLRAGLATLSNGHYIPGSMKKVTLASGQKITVGEYALIEEESYKYLRVSEEKGRNYLLESFKAVEKLGGWQGVAWNTMLEMLNDKKMSQRFGIVTARGHSRDEWKEFFYYLKDQGIIKYTPNLANIHNLAQPEYNTFGKSTADRKANVLSYLAVQGLGRVTLTDADVKIDRNGKSVEKAHVLIYADDSQENIREVTEALEKITSGRYAANAVKVVIVNAGYEKEVRESNRPRVYVLRSEDGQPRKITKEEMQRDLSILNSFNFDRLKTSRSLGLTCQGLFQ